jgi:GTPase SAR1 family protein
MIGLIGTKIDLIDKMVINDEMLNNKVEEIKKIFPKSKVICRTVSSKTNDGIQELLLDIVCIANIKIKNLYIGNEDYEGFELVSDDVVERLKQRKPVKNQNNNGIFSKFFNFYN